MAKVIKADREIMDVDDEIKKLSNEVVGSKKVENRKNSDDNKKKKIVKKKVKSKKGGKTKKNTKKVSFFKEVKSEVAKVKWPSKKDMVKYSIATIVFVVFFAVFFYLIDLIIALLKAGV